MYLLFDIGGTNMRLAVSKDGKRFLAVKVVPTPKRFEDGIKLFQKIGKDLLGKHAAKAIAGGIPGPLDKKKTMVINAPNLPGWNKKPFVSTLRKAFRCSVYLENDAAVAGLGEAVFGAGKGKAIVAYLGIGTGVGGARIVDGKIDASAHGFEPGHQLIAGMPGQRAPKCLGCKESGHLEAYVSGIAMQKRFHKKPFKISRASVWEDAAVLLAQGVINLTVLWSPDAVVLGGSMMKKVGISLDRVRFHVRRHLRIFSKAPSIQKAKLGDLGGLYGALALFKRK